MWLQGFVMVTPIPWLFCPQAISWQIWKCAWGHCPLGRPIFDQAFNSLTDIRCCFNILSLFSFLLMATILLESSPTTWQCPCASTIGIMFFSLQEKQWPLWPNNFCLIKAEDRATTVFALNFPTVGARPVTGNYEIKNKKIKFLVSLFLSDKQTSLFQTNWTGLK